ncbi:cobyric acid synthase [Helicovermis profundi]|uniref:Cobyric acid synthase n=1 Tax=Helicovermis profundi TaxID=3065157 RepID=A0AAU9E297_9FIRM|nr:cobyric acid synthase [Clostridia bacterium S502]
MKKNSIMIQGTGSSVGKSIMVAGLCRVMMQDGYNVSPFKSQNMALNSYITENGLEMGRAQVVQAEACGKKPSVKMNPILLKPSAEKKAQVIVNGKVYSNMSAKEYHEYKLELKDVVKKAYVSLSNESDFVVIEGAGSPAEINLREKDIVNMGMAEISDSPVIIVGDIDKGGVFASLYGTIMLLTEKERQRVKGVIINKFRGDIEILKPGLKMLENLIKLPVLGVMPLIDVQIEDEDSLSDRVKKSYSKKAQINVEVLYLPHVSNFTDFDVFETQNDVNLRYVMRGESINNPDILIIPGSKNTIEDLVYLKNTGLDEQIIRLSKRGKYVVGICGGYQILGRKIRDPHFTESAINEINGIGLLSVETVFDIEKVTTQAIGTIDGAFGEDFKNKEFEVKGYEIHMGESKLIDGAKHFINLNMRLDKEVNIKDGSINEQGNVFGTYMHGIFDNLEFTRFLLNNIRKEKGLDEIENAGMKYSDFKEIQYNKLADSVRKNIDMEKIYDILKC